MYYYICTRAGVKVGKQHSILASSSAKAKGLHVFILILFSQCGSEALNLFPALVHVHVCMYTCILYNIIIYKQ